MGISIDHLPALKAWTDTFEGIHYPLLSDFWPHGAVAKKYGVLRAEGYTERAIFVIDDDGIIRYIDIHDIDKQPSNKVLFEEIKKLRPDYVEPDEIAFLPRGGVVMYSTRWCPDSRRARNWLADHGIEYKEVDIMTDPGAAAQVRAWNNDNLVSPTFDIDGDIVSGFDSAELTRLLKGR